MRLNLREIAEAAVHDPAQALLDAAGDLGDYVVFHNLVLVATYIAPPKTFKNERGEEVTFHLSDNAIAEDRFQGKVGLVLKVGPLAFRDDDATKFGSVSVSPGDWVIYRPSDGSEIFIRDRRKSNSGLSCRLVEDTFIRGQVTDPSLIY